MIRKGSLPSVVSLSILSHISCLLPIHDILSASQLISMYPRHCWQCFCHRPFTITHPHLPYQLFFPVSQQSICEWYLVRYHGSLVNFHSLFAPCPISGAAAPVETITNFRSRTCSCSQVTQFSWWVHSTGLAYVPPSGTPVMATALSDSSLSNKLTRSPACSSDCTCRSGLLHKHGRSESN